MLLGDGNDDGVCRKKVIYDRNKCYLVGCDKMNEGWRRRGGEVLVSFGI